MYWWMHTCTDIFPDCTSVAKTNYLNNGNFKFFSILEWLSFAVVSVDGQEASSSDVISRGETYQKKIIYSKLLSSAEDSKFEHSTMFRLNNDSESGMATLPSIPVIITPPYGSTNNNNLLFIILAIVIILIITFTIIKLKKK